MAEILGRYGWVCTQLDSINMFFIGFVQLISPHVMILSVGNSAGTPQMWVGWVAAQISNDITEVIHFEW